MRFVYFTKMLRELDVKALVAFCAEVGLDGVDLAVRPGYPVRPDNVAAALPDAVKAFKDAGLAVGLVTAETTLTDAASPAARALFEACGKAGVPAIKVGYFPYAGTFDDALKSARSKMAAFAKLAADTGVKACYHTHSGNMIGNNAAALRLLLADLDPHHAGAFVDTGHTAVNGGPIRLELDTVRAWLSLLAIKDMAWDKAADGWKYHVVPAGEGIVRWKDVGAAVQAVKFNGTVSLHAEYETKDLDERKRLAKAELALLKKVLG
jgi:sugar phosphate isomerase/epimerase